MTSRLPPVQTLSPEDIERFGPDPEAAFRVNLAAVEARIAAACARAGRDRASVRLLPITKTVPAHILRLAHAAGVRPFGENKIQEAVGKRELLQDLPIDWCIVGHLQSNKAKYLARFAREFHALDSAKLAELLDRRLEIEDRVLDVYIQVNTSDEDTKYGLHPDALIPFIETLGQYRTPEAARPDDPGPAQCRHGEGKALLRPVAPPARRGGQAQPGPDRTVDGHVGRFRGSDRGRIERRARRPGDLRQAADADGHYWPGLLKS